MIHTWFHDFQFLVWAVEKKRKEKKVSWWQKHVAEVVFFSWWTEGREKRRKIEDKTQSLRICS